MSQFSRVKTLVKSANGSNFLDMQPLVSVIIPTYNRAYCVERAIRSVLNQTYSNLEVILIDDGSKDDTPKLVSSYPLRYVRLPCNFGVSFARNRGILKAKGDFLAFLDSDDEFLPTKIEKQIKYLEKNPEIKLVQTEELWFRRGQRLNPKKYHAKAEGPFLHRAVKLCVVSPSTLLVKREVFQEIGLFDETFPVCEDYEFFLRVALKTPMGLIKEPLVIKHGGRADQLSQQRGLDFYRVKALLKTFRNFFSTLSPEERLILLSEAQLKSRIFIKGALKHGNLQKIFELWKIWSNLYPKPLRHFT